MKSAARLILVIMTCFGLLALSGCKIEAVGMLNPKGIIAFQERKLFFDTMALMMIVVLPVIIMSFAFAYHYQVSHRVRDYKPNWGHNYFLETLWWGIPCAIIIILSVMTWKKTVELDPYRSITTVQDEKPLIVQAIALPWKWLFIYPEQNIATVNQVVLPAGKEVEFWLTCDNVPMSSFIIAQLGSQIYAMAGMRTRLHLMSNQPGTYEGMNTQFNGNGFSDMHFTVQVVTADKMQQWVDSVKKSTNSLNEAAYDGVSNPS